MAEIVPRYNTTNDYSPAVDAVAVTPADGADLQYNGVATPCRIITVNVSGVVSMDIGSATALLVAFVAGTPQYIRAKRIRATGTTATGITAWY